MEAFGLLNEISKPIIGVLAGILIGIFLNVVDAGFWGVIPGAMAVCLFLFTIGFLEFILGLVLWVICIFIEVNFHLMEKAIMPLSIAGSFGGGTWGAILEDTFRFASLFFFVLAMIILYKLIKSNDERQKTAFLGGIGLIIGLILGLILWFGGLSPYSGEPWTIIVWVISGALLGIGVGLIPFL